MPDLHASLNDKLVADLPLAVSGQYFVKDIELPGFWVLVGKRRKTFVVQGERKLNGQRLAVRMKLGDVRTAHQKRAKTERQFGMATRDARAKAKKILGMIADGIDPRETTGKKRSAQISSFEPSITEPTLRIAWERYRDAHMKKKGRSEGTIKNYSDHVERLLADWLDEPLSKLGNDPSLVTMRHEKLTSENGSYIANGCMRTLRAVYNHARKSARSLPADNPVAAVDWNAESRRDTALGLADLQDWFAQLVALKNPIRREFHLFLLLSGHRPDAIKKARVEHVDFQRRILHVPKPKGGEVRAFDIPLSRAMIRCVIRAMRVGRLLYAEQSQGWLFPAESESGHISEQKERRSELSKWGNELRQTFRTVAQAAGIPELDVHLLMNHSIPGVNAGYITRNKLLSDHLRLQQEVISRKVIEATMSCKGQGKPAQREWFTLPSRQLLADLIKTTRKED